MKEIYVVTNVFLAVWGGAMLSNGSNCKKMAVGQCRLCQAFNVMHTTGSAVTV